MNQARPRYIHWKYLSIILAVFAVGTAIDVVTLNLFGFAVGGIGATLAMVVAILIAYRHTGERFSFTSLARMLRLVKPRFPTIWDKLFVAIAIVGIVAYLFVVAGADIAMPSAGVLLYALSAAIIPPAIEELANRGFIQTSLERLGYSVWWVVGISTFIFAVSHYPVNPDIIPACFVVGAIFGIVTVRTKSVVIPFLLHGLWNFVAVAF